MVQEIFKKKNVIKEYNEHFLKYIIHVKILIEN